LKAHDAVVAVPDELLTISAFARRVGLTPSALRFYDDCGLLHPAQVDASSGYRLYASEQEPRAVLLRLLREVDLPLVQARIVLDGPADEASRVIHAHVRTLEDRLGPARRAAAIVLASLSSTVGGCRVTLPGLELASAVRQVAPAAATTSVLPALACVLIELGGDEVVVVASDRYRLAMRVLQARRFDGAARRLLVPAAVLSKLAQWAARYEEVHISVAEDSATLNAGGEQHLLPMVDAEFPDYQAILGRLAPPITRAIVDRASLLHLLVNGGLPPTVAITVGLDQVRVGVPGGTDTVFDAVCTGEAVRVGFAPSVLGAALDASVGPDVLLELAGPARAVIIRSADQGTFTTLAMPTLLKPDLA
jgi:DNA-binding transcriptional MerR regulator